MNLCLSFIIGCSGFLLTTSVLAQEKDCSDILQIYYAYYDIEDDLKFRSTLREIIIKDDEKIQSEARSLDVFSEAVIPIADFIANVSGSGSYSDEEITWIRDKYKYSTEAAVSKDEFRKIVLRVASKGYKEMIDAWKSCGKKGVVTKIDMNNTEWRKFTFSAKWTNPFGVSNPGVTEFLVDGATCVGESFKKRSFGPITWNRTLPSEFASVTCTRKDSSGVIITLNTDKNGGRGIEMLEAILPQPPQPTIPDPPTLIKYQPLYAGMRPNCNQGIVASHEGHANCENRPIGFSIEKGPAAQKLLYLGTTPERNAGIISTKSNYGGGASKEWGYTISEEYKMEGSEALYVVKNCGVHDGEVSDRSGHRGCETDKIGWTFKP